MIDMTVLQRSGVWNEWRFEAWEREYASGLYRRASFIKAGLIGEVARYYADDYIVLRYGDDVMERLMADAKPERDLMVQRYVLIAPDGKFECKKKAFWMGFKGFAEFYRYVPKSGGYRTIKDLTPLIDHAWQKASEEFSVLPE